MRSDFQRLLYEYTYGEYESVTRPLWIYGHVCILLATALVGYTAAEGEYPMTLALLPFPMVYLYKRYEKARTYKVGSDTPV